MVDLNALLQMVFDQRSFDLAIDYSQDPVPPLRPDGADWLRGILRSRGYADG
jgi:hypothetical protein